MFSQSYICDRQCYREQNCNAVNLKPKTINLRINTPAEWNENLFTWHEQHHFNIHVILRSVVYTFRGVSNEILWESTSQNTHILKVFLNSFLLFCSTWRHRSCTKSKVFLKSCEMSQWFSFNVKLVSWTWSVKWQVYSSLQWFIDRKRALSILVSKRGSRLCSRILCDININSFYFKLAHPRVIIHIEFIKFK